MWTAFASVFSLHAGLFARALCRRGRRKFLSRVCQAPSQISISAPLFADLGLVTTAFCMLRLHDVIAALVVIRIMVQFLLQVLGLLILRSRHPELPRPFRMWLYPIPALLAALGFILCSLRTPNLKEIRFGAAIAFVGFTFFLVRSWRRKEWPFSGQPAHNPVGDAVQ